MGSHPFYETSAPKKLEVKSKAKVVVVGELLNKVTNIIIVYLFGNLCMHLSIE